MITSVFRMMVSAPVRRMTCELPMKHLLLLPALAVVCACSPRGETAAADSALASGVQPAGIVCRPTPNGRDVTGCYLTLTSAMDDRLVSIASPEAERGEIHEMKTEGGVMRMRELPDGLPLPAGQTVPLRPGGDHIMLFGLKRPLVAGDAIRLTLTFEKAPPLEVRAHVAQPTAGGH